MYLYIHIPFCQSKCIYCDFAVVLNKYGGQQAYLDVLTQELQARLAAVPRPTPVETIYVGGGTPSLLGADDYARLFDTIRSVTPFSEHPEITIEANPTGASTLSEADCRLQYEAYRAVGFNRISIGVQSLNDGELKKLSRTHTAQDVFDFVRYVANSGFDNISVDLMYGIPTQTMVSWQNTVTTALKLPITHISMYGLKVEPKTPLKRLVKTGAYPLPDDDTTVEMYFEAVRFLESRGKHQRLMQYEFSNLAKLGYASRHNLNYWQNGPYLAVGLGAHGYMNHTRYENTRDWDAYMDNPMTSGKERPCSQNERLENALIFGLRQNRGVHIPTLEQEFGVQISALYGNVLMKYQEREMLEIDGPWLRLTPKAIPYSNEVLAEFLLLDGDY